MMQSKARPNTLIHTHSGQQRSGNQTPAAPRAHIGIFWQHPSPPPSPPTLLDCIHHVCDDVSGSDSNNVVKLQVFGF